MSLSKRKIAVDLPLPKRPSVFDRLGTKGFIQAQSKSKNGRSEPMIGPARGSKIKESKAKLNQGSREEDSTKAHNKSLHSAVVKAVAGRDSPDLNWENWDQKTLEQEDEKVLEKKLQMLQRELEKETGVQEKVTTAEKGKIKKGGSRRNRSSSSSSTSSSSSSDSSSTSDSSSSSSSSDSSQERKKSKARKTKRTTSVSVDRKKKKIIGRKKAVRHKSQTPLHSSKKAHVAKKTDKNRRKSSPAIVRRNRSPFTKRKSVSPRGPRKKSAPRTTKKDVKRVPSPRAKKDRSPSVRARGKGRSASPRKRRSPSIRGERPFKKSTPTPQPPPRRRSPSPRKRGRSVSPRGRRREEDRPPRRKETPEPRPRRPSPPKPPRDRDKRADSRERDQPRGPRNRDADRDRARRSPVRSRDTDRRDPLPPRSREKGRDNERSDPDRGRDRDVDKERDRDRGRDGDRDRGGRDRERDRDDWPKEDDRRRREPDLLPGLDRDRRERDRERDRPPRDFPPPREDDREFVREREGLRDNIRPPPDDRRFPPDVYDRPPVYDEPPRYDFPPPLHYDSPLRDERLPLPPLDDRHPPPPLRFPDDRRREPWDDRIRPPLELEDGLPPARGRDWPGPRGSSRERLPRVEGRRSGGFGPDSRDWGPLPPPPEDAWNLEGWRGPLPRDDRRDFRERRDLRGQWDVREGGREPWEGRGGPWERDRGPGFPEREHRDRRDNRRERGPRDKRRDDRKDQRHRSRDKERMVKAPAETEGTTEEKRENKVEQDVGKESANSNDIWEFDSKTEKWIKKENVQPPESLKRAHEEPELADEPAEKRWKEMEQIEVEEFSDFSDDDDDILNREDETVIIDEHMSVTDEVYDRDEQPASQASSPDQSPPEVESPVKEATPPPPGQAEEEEETPSKSDGAPTQEPSEEDFMDFEEISDEELEEEKENKPSIVDALEIDWASLMSVSSTQPDTNKAPGSASRRFSTAKIISRLGVSVRMAGDKLMETLRSKVEEETNGEVKTLELLHSLPGMHQSLKAKAARRKALFSDIGPHRRALCARKDLAIRRELCNLSDRDLPPDAQSLHFDRDLFKLSVDLFKRSNRDLSSEPSL